MPQRMLANLEQYSQKMAKPFFFLSTFYLILFALIIHWSLFFKKIDESIPNILLIGFFLSWLPFLIDAFIYFLYNLKKLNIIRLIGIIIFPPSRIMHPAWCSHHYIWLPRYGWQFKTKKLAIDLEQQLDTPMLVIALLILPIMSIEFIFKEPSNTLRNLLYFSTMFIWFSFTLEFIIKLAVAPKKLLFCKANIINIAIIILPLLSFLRGLRVLRAATPFLNHGKLLGIAKTMRLRGLAMKIMKGLMSLSLIQKLIKKVRRPANLKALHERQKTHEEELLELQEKIQNLELKILKIKKDIHQLETSEEINENNHNPTTSTSTK